MRPRDDLVSPRVLKPRDRLKKGLLGIGLGFRVWGLGFRVQGLGFRVQGSGFRV